MKKEAVPVRSVGDDADVDDGGDGCNATLVVVVVVVMMVVVVGTGMLCLVKESRKQELVINVFNAPGNQNWSG